MNDAICIVGTGYVGMASMVGFAELGFRVHGYDIVPERIERLKQGSAPYREAGLEDAIARHLATGKMSFYYDLAEAASGASIVVIAVGTPSRDDGSADLSALHDAVDSLSKIVFTQWPTIVIRSTVPPGTCDTLVAKIERFGEIVYAPEFLREGSAVSDFLKPDRIVVGAGTNAAAVAYVKLFESLQQTVLFTTLCNAEMIKCCSNAYLALKISFANEVANLCDALGAGSDDVLRGIGYDKRIGSEFLRPGIGFGGPCFEKDVKSIRHVAARREVGRELFSATLRVNENQPRVIVDALERELGTLNGARIGVWGLAFKAGTDDVRDSLALRILDDVTSRGAVASVYDPAVHVARLPHDCVLVKSALEAADADALLVLTEWPEFADVNPHAVAERLTRKIVIDGRNVLDGERYGLAGLRYRGVGRRSLSSIPTALVQNAAV